MGWRGLLSLKPEFLNLVTYAAAYLVPRRLSVFRIVMVIPVFLCVLLTQIVSQEVGREALGAVAHGRVVVRVSSEHQHRPAHDHRCVEVTEEAAVSQDGPAQTHTQVDGMRAPQK